VSSSIVAPSVRARVKNSWGDPLRLALFGLMLLTTSRVHEHFGVLSALRPALLLAGLACAYAFLHPRSLGGTRWLRTWPAKVVVALGVMVCLSAVFGISLGGSAKTILQDYSKVLVFAFLLMATIRGTADLRAYVWAYVISGGVLVWLSLFVFGLDKVGPDGLARLNFRHTYDANDVGTVLLVALGLGLLTFYTSRLKGRLVSGVILLGIGATLAKSGSRGALIGLVAALLALLLLVTHASVVSRLAILVVVIGGLAVASPPGYWDQMKTILRPTEDYNWTEPGGRKQIWLHGLGYMKSYPLFGVGIGNFGRAEGTISEQARNWSPDQAGIRWIAPHNSFVEAGAELGVPGLVLWSSLVLGGIVAMRRLRRRLPKSWAVGDPEQRFLYLATSYLPVALTGFAASAFFVSFTFLDPIYILAAFMTGMYVCAERKLVESRAAGSVGGPNSSGARRRIGRAAWPVGASVREVWHR
jgi:O-antigen ligase